MPRRTSALLCVLFLSGAASCSPSSVSGEDENRLLMREMLAAVDSVDDFKMRRLMSPDIVIHFGTETLGADDIVTLVENYYESFPATRHDVDLIIARDDMVAARVCLHGKHEGVFRGFEPTGVEVTTPAMYFARVEDGRFVEWWATLDNLAMLEQIGLDLPPREP